MNIKFIFKIISLAILFGGMVGIGFYFVLPKSNEGQQLVTTISKDIFGWKFPITKFPATGSTYQVAYSNIRDPGGVPKGLPVRLKIPTIGVDSNIEDALITNDGRMDVPAGSLNVAWFSLGPHPGQEGSAVIGGHYGIKNGVPFVFYKLDKLKKDDKIYIVDDKGDTLAFVIRSIKLFDRDADATSVFSSEDGKSHLNLITCEGIWNKVNDTYPERRVVFADLISLNNTAPISFTKNFPRVFGMGAEGEDVKTLQGILEQKELLKIPSGITKGYFGELTRSAVIKYQISVNLPPVGNFGPLTRAKLILELDKSNLTFPDAGADAVLAEPVLIKEVPTSTIEKGVSTYFETLFELVKNLYSTVTDGLITSTLLILVLFMAFKIIRYRHKK